ncbi:MAG: hypothetical protein IPJ33_04080 [Gammaproteobacteria bacterium]|jgi:hypothetical protein|nr:hypothetical protein [Gammaproteobacteria bacterium]MBP6053376.1 hypothetical protein [Pseudomonadales bacterium]MBK6583493.1 hypothetical protein [Gammaproteobacteria bacterium]MBK7171118.1 hypothetical protein [Gammaproteobacteria bacterium]MBK7727696.1 hypothetical protein [Gammaproteobacteria bacterium]
MNCNTAERCERPAAGSGTRLDRAHAVAVPAEQAFAQQIAAFYPYAHDPENAPGRPVSGAAPERSRTAAMQPGSGLMRRRQARDD